MAVSRKTSRREFFAATAAAGAGTALAFWPAAAGERAAPDPWLEFLPKGPAPKPVTLSHFPDRRLRKYGPPDSLTVAGARQIAAVVKEEFGRLGKPNEPLFAFVEELSGKPRTGANKKKSSQPRFCYSYFALYGDPLMDDSAD